MTFPPGVSPFMAYPLAAHALARVPWELEFRRTGQLFLCSFSCTGIAATRVCDPCASLADDSVLRGISARVQAGAKEGTSYHWLGMSQLQERLDRALRENNRLKLSSLNTGRTLAVRTKHIAQYKRFMQIVAKGMLYGRLGISKR